MYRGFWPVIAGEPTRKGRPRLPRLVSHPDEVKIVSRRFGKGAAKIERYLELGGYASARKCL
jgi:hypothetical protein